jgi:hypothetical protein
MKDGRPPLLGVVYYLYLGFIVSFVLKAMQWWGLGWGGLLLVVLAVPAVFLERTITKRRGSGT